MSELTEFQLKPGVIYRMNGVMYDVLNPVVLRELYLYQEGCRGSEFLLFYIQTIDTSQFAFCAISPLPTSVLYNFHRI